jgi:ketosteroid isomerase-like protein
MSLRAEVEATLDAFHAAAAAADADAYAATISDEIVFLGTAPGERWEGAAWRSFFRSYFAQGKGWTYVPSERSVVVSADGTTGWFDETVENQHYGACRGTGVVRLEGGVWRIEQYNLTIPVPDALAPDLVERIRELGST